MKPRKRVRREKDRRTATHILADRRAQLLGDHLSATLQIATLSEPWIRWTCALAIALSLERAIMPIRCPFAHNDSE